MAWELLPVNYTDASWEGLKKYKEQLNGDGSKSFLDVTDYHNKENSFFGAKDANQMNEAINTIMSMLENGTDLYTAFQNYFSEQKSLFENNSNLKSDEFKEYLNTLKTAYNSDLETFKENQKEIFNNWFSLLKNQLSGDVAANLATQIQANTTKIDTNTGAIQENKTNIQNNTQAIAKNTQAIEKTMQAMSNITNRRWVCDIGVNGWIENNGVWTQEVNCEGLTADIVLLGDIYSIQTDNIDELVLTFDNYKRAYRIESMNGKIKIYASLKPMKAFQMQFIEVARVK